MWGKEDRKRIQLDFVKLTESRRKMRWTWDVGLSGEKESERAHVESRNDRPGHG